MSFNKSDSIKITELAKKYNITIEEVEGIVLSQSEFIKLKTSKLVLVDGLSKEQFDSLKTNFNLPSIGKLFASFYIYGKINHNKTKK